MTASQTQPTNAPICNDNHHSASVISARGLEKRYGSGQNAIHAVRGLDLEVGRGQIYGFLGPNGAGKTTTIRMLLGLMRPTAGEVRLFGQTLQAHRSNLLARVGSIVETPSAYAHLTGRENLEITRRLLAAPPANIPRLLELVGLRDAADRAVRGYSLGMKGRLSLAAALMNSPELLVLDEPSNGLDPSGIREMRDLIRTFPAQGITVLVSSHLLSEIEQIATHVGIVAGGRMRFSGSLESLRAQSTPNILIELAGPHDRLEDALRLVRKTHPDAHLNDTHIHVPTHAQRAAPLNRQLIEAGFDILRLEPRNASLEELFMHLIEEEAR